VGRIIVPPSTLRPRTVPPVPLSSLEHRLRALRVGAPVDPAVTGVSCAADDVRPGDVFAAVPGTTRHGVGFVHDAVGHGAVAVLTDVEGRAAAAATGLPVLVAGDVRGAMGRAAAAVYRTHETEETPLLLGVTGTNGKTSTVHILHALLGALGMSAALSSTVERRSGDAAVPSRLTSPESTELHALVARAREDGAAAVAVEVSAQAMTRQRTAGLVFDVAGFTTFSHDHLDEYSDLDAYARAKAALFRPAAARRGVVSLDSDDALRVVDRARVPLVTVSSRTDRAADWRLRIGDERRRSTALSLHAADGRRLDTEVSLIGRHMAADAALALVMLLEAGIDVEHLRAATADGIRVEVPGRTVPTGNRHGPQVYLDFSHTPESFASTLRAIRRITPGRLVMVMGADGDRDASKRREMGRLSALGSDTLIVTDHHPRFEEPAHIRADLLRGAALARPAEVIEIADPHDAIRSAIARSDEGDSILWAGPGLTGYRDVAGVHVAYSSFDDARAALAEAGWS